MKIMTWNIKDGGALDFQSPITANIDNILDTIRKEAPDVIAIQEYESRFYNKLVGGLDKLSYMHTVCEDQPDRTSRKRVMIASKQPFSDVPATEDILKYSQRNWREIIMEENSFHILGVHVPLATAAINGVQRDNRREKKLFLDAMKKKFTAYQKCEAPCVICGDFNLHSDAVYKEYLEDFAACLTEVTTPEATLGKHKFDYIFANEAAKKLIKPGELFHPHPTAFSDHSYLCIETV